MSLFAEWNLLLLEEYFSPTRADQDVWVPTTRLELEGIGIHKGGANGLIEAVRRGPTWIHGNENIAVNACELVKQRSAPRYRPNGYKEPDSDKGIYQGANAPTYLPYIALWVLARSEVGDAGFYAKVSELVSGKFPNNTRNQMEAVWFDLECWSSNEQKGKFGRFKLSVLGEHKFVGMAYAQAMVTHKDIDGISRLFGSCRLHPGQAISDGHFNLLLESGENSNYLSAGLKTAMGKPEYKEHLKQLLSAYLEFWDGRVPKRINANNGASNKQVELQQGGNDELSIILQLKTYGEIDSWEIGWRLPAVVTGADYTIKVDETEESKARLELAGTHIFSINCVSQNNARCALNRSATRDVEATLSYTENDGVRCKRKYVLKQDKIRFLVWDKPDPSLSDSLIEHEMPILGPVYLLYSRAEYLNLELILKNQVISHEAVNEGGLPDDWGLIYIDAIENLTVEQRTEIADEEPTAQTRARIRFVGGKPIIGAGSKKYAYYDLPIIELEAPNGAELKAIGLTFEELDNADTSGVRRFKYSLDDGSGCAFKIKAILADEVLCTAGLQLMTAGGMGTAKRHYFSVDNFGRPLTDATGLCGAIIGDKQTDDLNLVIDYFQVDEKTLADKDELKIWQCMESNLSSRFLDSIAITLTGSMTYGAARDQIRRLASSIGIENIEPALLIRDLRRKGHVEIETNAKGHMVRICAVPPTLYSLPIKDVEQRQLYGVCGSLRLQQWKELVQANDCGLIVEETMSHNLPVIRVVPRSPSTISEIAKVANFQVVDFPVQQLSQWLGSINEIKNDIAWYPEQGFKPNDMKKLNPLLSQFGTAQSMLVDPSRKYELFRYEDPQIQGMNVYKLGKNLGDGFSTYSFIQDSRWGVWMAVGAFAEWIKNPPYSIDDASPWPFHYDIAMGCLWIPARMEPPYVIERALTLCAGDGPLVIEVIGEENGDSLLLSEKGQGMIGKVSRVYSAMASGKWLCYRWVPNIIASQIASLLGGELKAI